MEALKVSEHMDNWNDDRLDAFAEEVKAGFEKVDARLALTATREEMKEGFEKVDARFEKVDARFEKVDERFEKVDERFKEVNARLALTATRQEMNEVNASIHSLERALIGGIIAIVGALIGIHFV
ncbi:MAG: hypothetical protein ACTHO8_08200 [Solirubrobacterales bacterium]